MATPADAVCDPRRFTLRDMALLGSALRRLDGGARSMDRVACGVVRHLYDHLIDTDTSERACALVRFFKTHDYEQLSAELRAFARTLLPGDVSPSGLRCLTLLATAGDRPEWNSPRNSAAHRAIPLASKDMVSKAPMISSLLQQLGVRVEALLSDDRSLLVEQQPSTFNVFYVPRAVGSPYIPAQADFVTRYGIRSVLGFGGMLPLGDIFCVILFSKVSIPRETAELFRTLALNVKVAVLPFQAAVFAGDSGPSRASR